MERMVYLYRDGRRIGVYNWNSLPLREQAILVRSRELFGHVRPCGRQRRMIRTALLLELERALVQGGQDVPESWRKYTNTPPCDRVCLNENKGDAKDEL